MEDRDLLINSHALTGYLIIPAVVPHDVTWMNKRAVGQWRFSHWQPLEIAHAALAISRAPLDKTPPVAGKACLGRTSTTISSTAIGGKRQ